MLWASDALGRDGKPAVLLLGVGRTSRTLTAEIAYVSVQLPAGPLPGRFYRAEGSPAVRVAIDWPTGWPNVGPWNRLHPRDTTPRSAVIDQNGVSHLRFNITEALS